MAPLITPAQTGWFRRRRSGLIEPYSSPQACAGALLGVQAQLLPGTGLALWNRTRAFSDAALERALCEERTFGTALNKFTVVEVA